MLINCNNCYLPCNCQISCLPPYYYLLIVVIILWQKVPSTLKTKNKEIISCCFYKRNKKLLHKHNKTLCNLNLYYLPPLSNILQVKQNKNNMIYFHIFHLYFQCHKHATSKEKDLLETIIFNTIFNAISNTISSFSHFKKYIRNLRIIFTT